MLLFAITAVALLWMHASILHMEGRLGRQRFLPELAGGDAVAEDPDGRDADVVRQRDELADWNPEDDAQ